MGGTHGVAYRTTVARPAGAYRRPSWCSTASTPSPQCRRRSRAASDGEHVPHLPPRRQRGPAPSGTVRARGRANARSRAGREGRAAKPDAAASGIHPPYNQLRKMACSFGWDWGPSTGTSGLWQPVELVTCSTGRLTTLDVQPRPLTSHGCPSRRRRGDGRLPTVGSSTARVALASAGAARRRRRAVRVDVPGAELWWPSGQGAQPLYDVTVTLVDADGDVLETRTDAWGSALSRWCRRLTDRKVLRDPRQLAAPVGCGASTGSPTTSFPSESPRSVIAPGSARRPRPESTSCASGAAGAMRPTSSMTRATSSACWSAGLHVCLRRLSRGRHDRGRGHR